MIERDGRPVGRLYRDLRADEIRVVDIALLAQERGRGVGGRLMRDILDEARSGGLEVRVHVERTNLARRLYDRANRPRPRTWPPVAVQLARLDEQIDGAREYGLAMGRQGHRIIAAWAMGRMSEAMRQRDAVVEYGGGQHGE